MEQSTVITLAAIVISILHLICGFVAYDVARDNYVNHIYGFVAGLLFGPIGVLMVENVSDNFSLVRFMEKEVLGYKRNQITDPIELYRNEPLMKALYNFVTFQTRWAAYELENRLRMGNMRYCRLVYEYLDDMKYKPLQEAAEVTRHLKYEYEDRAANDGVGEE